jgi:hypothetical protein
MPRPNLFNTSVEIPVRNSSPHALHPLLTGFFPLCTGHGAAQNPFWLTNFSGNDLQSFLPSREPFSTQVWKMG